MLALEGIRILDMAPMGPGPHCSQILADLGADVVKVEEPGPGTGRRAGRVIRFSTDVAIRRNSRSIGLNLKSEDGRRIFYDLAAAADVVIEGFRPGVVKRLGIDYATVRAQIHGGIGFNEDVDTTLFLRRGKQYQLSMGDTGYWEDIIAEEILDG